MYIVIIGCGRTGSNLAGLLSQKGHDVVVLDKDTYSFNKLPVEYSGFKVEGDTLEHDVLKNAKINTADIIVVTTGDDRINYMVTQMAREIFKVPKVMVRIVDPENTYMFEDLASVETFSPINLLVDSFIKKIERIEG